MVPWIAVQFLKKKSSLVLKMGVLFSWILFFPNAPYILTDLFHLKHKTTVPIWYDLILILSFAWTGLLLGFYSLIEIEKHLRHHFSNGITRTAVVAILFVSSFGVYIGRYLRWNSWDVVSDPMSILSDVISRFSNPLNHPTTWGMTLLLGIFLNLVYFSLKTFGHTVSAIKSK